MFWNVILNKPLNPPKWLRFNNLLRLFTLYWRMARHGFGRYIIIAIRPVQEGLASLWKILQYETTRGAAPFQGPTATTCPILNIETENRLGKTEDFRDLLASLNKEQRLFCFLWFTTQVFQSTCVNCPLKPTENLSLTDRWTDCL